jgi:hypothetical protein
MALIERHGANEEAGSENSEELNIKDPDKLNERKPNKLNIRDPDKLNERKPDKLNIRDPDGSKEILMM